MGNSGSKDQSLLVFGTLENGVDEIKYSAVRHCKKMCAYSWDDVTGRVDWDIPIQYGCFHEIDQFINIFNDKCKYFNIHTKQLKPMYGTAHCSLRHSFYKMIYGEGKMPDFKCIVFVVNSTDKSHLIDNQTGNVQIERKDCGNDIKMMQEMDLNKEIEPYRMITLQYNNHYEYHQYGFSGICYKYDLWNILRDKDISPSVPLIILCNKDKMEKDVYFSPDEIADILLLSAKPSFEAMKYALKNEQKQWNHNDDILRLIMEFIPGHDVDKIPQELKHRKINIIEVDIKHWIGMNDAFQWILDNIEVPNLVDSEESELIWRPKLTSPRPLP